MYPLANTTMAGKSANQQLALDIVTEKLFKIWVNKISNISYIYWVVGPCLHAVLLPVHIIH